MKLYFLRHGRAEDSVEGGTDYDRRLTATGIEEMDRVARALVLLIEEVGLILSSPLPRALETAQIVSTKFGLTPDRLVVSGRMAAGVFTLEELRILLADVPSSDRVVLVGHEPDLSILVGRLTGAAIEMKKAGLAFVEAQHVEPNAGVLRWLLTPRHLQLIGGDSD